MLHFSKAILFASFRSTDHFFPRCLPRAAGCRFGSALNEAAVNVTAKLGASIGTADQGWADTSRTSLMAVVAHGARTRGVVAYTFIAFLPTTLICSSKAANQRAWLLRATTIKEKSSWDKCYKVLLLTTNLA